MTFVDVFIKIKTFFVFLEREKTFFCEDLISRIQRGNKFNFENFEKKGEIRKNFSL